MSKQQTHPVIESWFKAVKEKNADQIVALLTPTISVAPPFLDHEVTGLAEVIKVFAAFSQVTENFEYGRQWQNGSDIVLEFFTRVEGEDIHGVDIININDEGQISRFDILARPQSSVQKLGAAVKTQLNKLVEVNQG